MDQEGGREGEGGREIIFAKITMDTLSHCTTKCSNPLGKGDHPQRKQAKEIWRECHTLNLQLARHLLTGYTLVTQVQFWRQPSPTGHLLLI